MELLRLHGKNVYSNALRCSLHVIVYLVTNSKRLKFVVTFSRIWRS